MSVYNGDQFIAEAIESVLNQTLKEFEFIIINDCSNDESLNIIREYSNLDKRIVLISNENNLGLSKSLNKGIDNARGKYIARFDADDIMISNRLQMQYDFLEGNKAYSFVGALVECFIDSSNLNASYASIEQLELNHFNIISANGDVADTAKLIRKNSYQTTMMCHSTLFGGAGEFKKFKYKEGIFAEDWEFYNRVLCNKLEITKLPVILVKYRILNSGMCGKFNAQSKIMIKMRLLKLQLAVLKNYIMIMDFKTALKFINFHSSLSLKIKILPLIIAYKIYAMLPSSFRSQLKLIAKIIYKSNLIRKIPFVNTIFNKIITHLIKRRAVGKDYSIDMKVDRSKIRIDDKVYYNISVWTIEKKWAMGGLYTILKMIPTILSTGANVRIINYGLHNNDLVKEFNGFLANSFGIDHKYISKIKTVPVQFYRENFLSFNPKDIFIAGFWEPAEDFIEIRRHQHFTREDFIYIIQDYEPSMLYRWGSEYIRSKNTLHDKKYYPIFNNSEFVYSYMKLLDFDVQCNDWQKLHGEPCVTTPPPVEKMAADADSIRLVFYSRPTVDKNIYQIKLKALKLFIDYVKSEIPEKFETMQIVGIGEEANDVNHNGFIIKNLGKLDYGKYPDFLQNFNLGLACIISPAFAYPCIEFPRAGIVTIVNKFENRDLSIYSENILSCENSAEGIFHALKNAIPSINFIETRFKGSHFNLPGVSIEYATTKMLEKYTHQ